MSRTIGIHMLGAGTMAREHAIAVRALDRPVEVHVADPSAAARQAFAADFPEFSYHEDPEAMLAAPAREGDIAIVATPPWLHREQIERAARSGRHVLCEKPLLLSAQDITPVADVLRETGRLLVCCSTRFMPNPATLHVRDLVSAGRLGEIYAVRWRHGTQRQRPGIEYQVGSRWFLDAAKNGGGCLMDWAAYELAILRDLLEPRAITVAQAAMARPEVPADLPKGVRFDVETHVMATLVFDCANGSRVPVQYERASASFNPDFEEASISGSLGSVAWDWLGLGSEIELTLRDASNEAGKTESFTAPGKHWLHDAPLHEMLAALEGRPHRAVVGGDALFQIATMRAIYRSAREGVPVTVSRADFADLPRGPT